MHDQADKESEACAKTGLESELFWVELNTQTDQHPQPWTTNYRKSFGQNKEKNGADNRPIYSGCQLLL